ncbi:MAG: serine hydrolase domain-containing protein, partial [Planctomycetota bacterium]|nr:serine hydrolase domain-containing protein [Planctomycetota bacterium]
LGVMKDGKIILERSYGWKDAGRTEPLEPDAVMRIASVTKPFTAACIRRMTAAGLISLDDRVFDLGQPGGGLLRVDPYPRLVDERFRDVTVRHLLEHTAGWDPEVAGDLTFRELGIAGAMGIASPPDRREMARWILGHPLQHSPGERRIYSNEGYFFLGLIIEKYTGRDYLEYLSSEVLEPAGIPRSEITFGRTLRSDQHEREPWYESRDLSESVLQPGVEVERAYGGWTLENHFSVGALIASPSALLRFMEAHYVIGLRIGLPREEGDSGGWTLSHTGGFAGTSSLARQRGDGIHYAVIFNKYAPAPGDYAVGVRTLLDRVIADHVRAWPE